MIRELILKRFFLNRSPDWSKVRKKFLKKNNICSVCLNKKGLEVHHIHPFHLFPELELNEKNLITLCRPKRCHLLFGHLNNWIFYNPNVIEDSKIWCDKIMKRKEYIW